MVGWKIQISNGGSHGESSIAINGFGTSAVRGGTGTVWRTAVWAKNGLCGCMYEIVRKFIAKYQRVWVRKMMSLTLDNDGHISKWLKFQIFALRRMTHIIGGAFCSMIHIHWTYQLAESTQDQLSQAATFSTKIGNALARWRYLSWQKPCRHWFQSSTLGIVWLPCPPLFRKLDKATIWGIKPPGGKQKLCGLQAQELIKQLSNRLLKVQFDLIDLSSSVIAHLFCTVCGGRVLGDARFGLETTQLVPCRRGSDPWNWWGLGYASYL